jgi:DNA-binding response OmpR family regulator
MRILIAEDSRVTRSLIRVGVTQLGYECREACDGAEAWEAYQAAGADVVLSDWLMPGLDGLELCQRIRATGGPGYTYFIFLTSLDDREHALQGMAAGADDYLTKPLNRQDLRLRLAVAERVTTLHRERTAAQWELGRLQGVQLAARTLQHELGNKLARTAGYVQLLKDRAASPDGDTAARRALEGVREAMRIVEQLQATTTLAEADWGPNVPTTIRLPPY